MPNLVAAFVGATALWIVFALAASYDERMSKIAFGRMLSDLTDRQVGDRTLRKQVRHKSQQVFQLVAAAGAMPIAKQPAKTP